MKKIRYILLALLPALVLMVTACADDGDNSGSSSNSGSVTPTDRCAEIENTTGYDNNSGVWEIYNRHGLANLRTAVANGDGIVNVKLVCDIDLQGSQDNQWAPIAEYNDVSYYGTFDGDNYTISGLIINDNTLDYQGLFGVIGNIGVVKNLIVKDVEITANEHVGAIVGNNEGTIANVHVDNATINGAIYVASIAATNNSNIYASSASNIKLTATSNGDRVGGIAGLSYGNIYASYVDNATISTDGSNGELGGITGRTIGDVVSSFSNKVTFTNTEISYIIGGVTGFTDLGDLNSNFFISDNTTLYGIGNTSSNDNATPVETIQALNDNVSVMNNAIANIGGKDIGYRFDEGLDNTSDLPQLVTYILPLESLTLAYTSTLVIGETSFAKPTLVYEPSGTTQQDVIYSIDNDSLADINPNTGVITVKSAGTVKVTVKSVNNGLIIDDFSLTITERERDLRCSSTIAPGYDNNSSGVWEIYNKYGLENLRTEVANGSDNISAKLVCDINLEGSPDNQWTPIGDNAYIYNGTFDGDNYTISGLYIDNESLNAQALFVGNSGTIKNLILKDVNITAGAGVAALVVENSGTIESVSVIGGSVTGKGLINHGIFGVTGAVGGIVGINGGNILYSHNTSVVNGIFQVGGIVGLSTGNIALCNNSGDVSGDNMTGGIAGVSFTFNPSSNASISGSYNTGNVTGKLVTGGVVGMMFKTNSALFYNSGDVSGDDVVGGIFGLSDNSTMMIGYNTGSVTGTDNISAISALSSSDSIVGVYYLKNSTVNTGLTGVGTQGGAIEDNPNFIRTVDSLADFKNGIVAGYLNSFFQDIKLFYINDKADNPPLLIDEYMLLQF